MAIILSAEKLIKKYGEGENIVFALNNISIKVEEGEFVSIIGTSGSGKSTLLNMLGGLDKPTSGEVYIDDNKLSKLNDEELTIFRISLNNPTDKQVQDINKLDICDSIGVEIRISKANIEKVILIIKLL